MEKIDARKLKTEAQQLIRTQVIRLRKAGKTYKEISEIVGIHRSTACTLYKAYESGGRKAIRIKKRGRPKGSCRTLDPEQEKRLKKAITDKTPDQLKFPFALWTRRAVQQLIQQLFSISKSQLKGKALSHLRMLQKRPTRVEKYFRHPKISYAA